MKNLHTISTIFGILITVFVFSTHSVAQENRSTLSGHVIDSEGNPLSKIKLAVKPIRNFMATEFGPRKPFASWQQTKTDKKGYFYIANIESGPSQLILLPEYGSDYKIHSIQIDKITYYSTISHHASPTWWGKNSFSVEPNTRLDNIIIMVKPSRIRIQGRVLIDKGQPLRNKEINATIRHRYGNFPIFFLSTRQSTGSSRTYFKTDADGYFVTYDIDDEEAEHAIFVEYDGVSAHTSWFRLKKNKGKDGLVFRLKNYKQHQENKIAREKKRQTLWAVNPKNGHAYKRIQCKSIEDAETIAKFENAYLVVIDDEAEQNWVAATFSDRTFYWIGLNKSQNSDIWEWTNGEPLKYTNWVSLNTHSVTSTKENANVALTFSSKKWMVIGNNNPLKPMVKHAIIEKEASN